jgi:hypothetical protein
LPSSDKIAGESEGIVEIRRPSGNQQRFSGKKLLLGFGPYGPPVA